MTTRFGDPCLDCGVIKTPDNTGWDTHILSKNKTVVHARSRCKKCDSAHQGKEPTYYDLARDNRLILRLLGAVP